MTLAQRFHWLFDQLRPVPDNSLILELGCGALVIPEQVTIGRAGEAFDEMDNLKDQNLAATLKALARRLVEMAGLMPRGPE